MSNVSKRNNEAREYINGNERLFIEICANVFFFLFLVQVLTLKNTYMLPPFENNFCFREFVLFLFICHFKNSRNNLLLFSNFTLILLNYLVN